MKVSAIKLSFGGRSLKEGGLTAAVKHLIELNTPGGTPTVSSFLKHNYFTAISSNNPPRKVLNEKYEFVRGIL